MSSIKKNFVWNTVLTVVGYIFPLITFPYVTRVLGVEGVGANQFAEGIVSYFTTFATLGMATVGVREIAKAKNNQELSRVFSSLFVLNLLTTIVAITALLISIQLIPSFAAHSRMLYIGTARILCATLLIEWFYRGLENFQFITIRSLIIRTVYVVSVFVYIKNADDYIKYFTLTTLMTVVNALVNIFYSKNFIKFSFKNLDFKPYLKPFIVLGVYMVLSQMYSSFNVMFLGAKCGDIEVGYYTTATKLYAIIMAFFTSFTTVMMPRMSKLLSEKKDDEFKIMTAKSIDFMLLFCIPVIIVADIYAPQIIHIIAGVGYEGAVTPMRIIMPLMLVIGYEQIIVIQMLMPLAKDNAIMINSIVGATVALILNLTIVPKLASVGSAIVWCSCELTVAVSAQIFVTKYVGYRVPVRKIVTTLVSYLPVVFICLVVNRYTGNSIVSMILGCMFVAVYFVIIELFVLKNQLLINNMNILKKKILR